MALAFVTLPFRFASSGETIVSFSVSIRFDNECTSLGEFSATSILSQDNLVSKFVDKTSAEAYFVASNIFLIFSLKAYFWPVLAVMVNLNQSYEYKSLIHEV